jgi:hypothetical protein
MTRRRRLLAFLLLATSLAGATTAHHHSILEDASGARPARPVLDARCALTETLSLHAIRRIVEREPCWSCAWHRLFAVSFRSALPEPVWRGGPLAALPPRVAASISRFTRLSRGPPAL